MATSGSRDYTLTAAQIIEQALKELTLYGPGETVSTADQDDALVRLNLMIKSEQAAGIKLWRYREAKLFTVKDQATYDLPGARAANVSEISETTIDANEASGQTVISVASTTGFADDDVIGIVQDDGTIHWSTIAFFSAGDTVTINDALTAAATSGNKVFVYTTPLERPLRITHLRMEKDSTETPIGAPDGGPMARSEYFNLPSKDDPGFPTAYYYDPQLGTGKLYLWPAPNTVDYEVNFTYLDQLQDIDNASESLDCPQEWEEYFVSNLAIRLAPMFGVTARQETIALAASTRATLQRWDQEIVDVKFYA